MLTLNKKTFSIIAVITLITAGSGAYAYSNYYTINDADVQIGASNVTIDNSNVTIGQNNTIIYPDSTPTPEPTATPTPTPTPTASPKPTPAPTPTPSPTPTLSVSFIKSNTKQLFQWEGNVTEYQFDVKVTVATGWTRPFGKNATSDAINSALKPLLDKYPLVNGTYHTDNGEIITTAAWTASYIVDGESIFSLYSTETFTDNQIKSLTNDLFEAISAAMNNA